MSNQTPKNWWETNRLRFNIGLIISGFIAYIFFFVLEGYKNFTLFALIFKGIGFFFIIGIANLFYFLGNFTDKIFNKKGSIAFRKQLFNLGFWFSILLPFLLPLSFIIFPAWNSGYEEIKNVPSDSELCGVYELNNNSKQFLIHQGYNFDSSNLELNSNNQYYFHKLPDNVLDGFGRFNKKTINQTGKWKTYSDNDAGCEIIIGGAGYTLGKKNNRLSILITIGDPDSREGIVYEKSSTLQNK